MDAIKNQLKELIRLSQQHLKHCLADEMHVSSTPSSFHFFSQLKKEHPKELTKTPEIKKFFIPTPKEPVKKVVEESPFLKEISSPQTFPASPSTPTASAPSLSLEWNEIKLESFSPSPPSFEKKEYLAFLQKKYLQGSFKEHPLNDDIAKIRKEEWTVLYTEPKILILLFPQDKSFQEFFKHLCRAISLVFHPAALMFSEEFEKNTKRKELLTTAKLKLILGNPSSITSHPFWSSFYKEEELEEKRFLKNIPLIPLLDSSLYLSQPRQKGVLWRNLMNAFAL